MLSGTMTGAWGAATGLGQASAGNARSTRVPGSLAWSRANGCHAVGKCRGGAPVGVRAPYSRAHAPSAKRVVTCVMRGVERDSCVYQRSASLYFVQLKWSG
jgi:hypothetical protein